MSQRGFAAVEPGGAGVVRMHACRSCGADTIWARSIRFDGWILLDANPRADGRYQVIASPQAVEAVVYADPLERAYRFAPHYAVCDGARRTAAARRASRKEVAHLL